MYDESLKHYRDTIAVMQGQWLEGHEKGVTEGMKKGVFEVARAMKANMVPPEQISLYTGLSTEDIESL